MKVKLDDLLLAMDFVSGGYSFDNEAFIDTETGETYLAGEAVDEELPADIYENEKYISIPSKNDLGIGKKTVIRFTLLEMPNQLDKVSAMFEQRGAYGKFKSLLQRLDLVEKWYAYEDQATEQALIDWCELNSIPLDNENRVKNS
ncbi:hypothetical protein [Catenovulum sediminis]|uniref:hypothetical protein n=1 Tax=Catenovulum sediminis TaxID=1740262 RepID=UPI00117E89F8|nr:hypothetical protein [Catenovulum sediminis]